MKISLIAGAITLAVAGIAQADYQMVPSVPAAPRIAPFVAPRAITPALDAFADVGRQLQLKTRWVQIDANVVAKNFPAWNAARASSHVATPDELRSLEILRATGAASVTERKINATNNQIAKFSFSPFDVIRQTRTLKLPELGPINDMVIPRDKALSDARQIEMPNLAKPQSKLPEMAPMPGIDGEFGFPFTAPLPAPIPYVIPQPSRETTDFLAYEFQLRANFIGEEIALELRSSNAASSIPLKATVKAGETVVFAVPNVLIMQGRVDMHAKIRRAFLLVTPALPQTPRN